MREWRGTRLKETSVMYSGLVWCWEKSISLGLADALGRTEYVVRDVIHAANVVDFTPQEGFADRFAKHFGVALGKNVNPLASMGMGLH